MILLELKPSGPITSHMCNPHAPSYLTILLFLPYVYLYLYLLHHQYYLPFYENYKHLYLRNHSALSNRIIIYGPSSSVSLCALLTVYLSSLIALGWSCPMNLSCSVKAWRKWQR